MLVIIYRRMLGGTKYAGKGVEIINELKANPKAMLDWETLKTSRR